MRPVLIGVPTSSSFGPREMTDVVADVRALPAFALGFFGVQLEGAREVPRKDLVAGRWRSALALAFLVWALMIASEDDEEWVGGGVGE